MKPATRWFDWSFAPIPKFDERFARQYRYELPPEFPLASPYSGIVHHLSGPILCVQLRFSDRMLVQVKTFLTVTFISHVGLQPLYSHIK